MTGMELIGDVNWSNKWIRSQMIGIRDRLEEVNGRIKSNTLNQWYFHIHPHTFCIQIHRKEKVMKLFKMIHKEWKEVDIFDSFFSLEVWLERFLNSKDSLEDEIEK